jgi:flavodoxin
MKPIVLYLSHTGNTKRLAEAIAEQMKTPIFDIASSEPKIVEDCDLIILGTPVMGMKPAPEVSAFVKRLPEGNGKRVIVFCTYAFAKGGVLNVLEKELSAKGYVTVLSVGKKGLKPGKADFKDVLAEVSRVMDEQTQR